MALSVQCDCGHAYELKDEYAGRLVRCPKCQAVSRAERQAYMPTSQADPVFDRDVYLLRQKHLAINEKYVVSDEAGTPLVFVERPAHVLRTLLALAVGVTVSVVVFVIFLAAATALGKGEGAVALVLLGALAATLAFPAAAAAASKRRHVTFYRDESRRERLLEILQDQRLQLIVATFTIRDAQGQPLARLRTNRLYGAFRKRWELRTLAGHLALVVKEDSIIRSLLRRIVGPLYGLLRTNFVFFGPDDRILGEFNRKVTVLDRYVLDLRPDRHRKLDRRLGLALGLMLDTGERR